MINRWMKQGLTNFITKQITFCVFRTLWLVIHTLLTNTCSKLKVETVYCYTDCGLSQQLKHHNDDMLHLFLTLNTFSKSIYFFIINIEHVFDSWAQD